MGQMDLYFNIKDIFRAPRLALSGKKIWIFMIGNLAGFVSYWILTYFSFALAGPSPPLRASARALWKAREYTHFLLLESFPPRNRTLLFFMLATPIRNISI